MSTLASSYGSQCDRVRTNTTSLPFNSQRTSGRSWHLQHILTLDSQCRKQHCPAWLVKRFCSAMHRGQLHRLLLSAAALQLELVARADPLSLACTANKNDSCVLYQTPCAAASACSDSYKSYASAEPGDDGCDDVCCQVCNVIKECNQFCARYSSDDARRATPCHGYSPGVYARCSLHIGATLPSHNNGAAACACECRVHCARLHSGRILCVHRASSTTAPSGPSFANAINMPAHAMANVASNAIPLGRLAWLSCRRLHQPLLA